jgi:hypothetical protein
MTLASEYKSVREANQGLVSLLVGLIEHHLTVVQSGALGEPTRDDLEFCGSLHNLHAELLVGMVTQ